MLRASLHAEPLFRPITISSLNLPNRIVMAPMTRSFSPLGVPGPDVAAYYRRRAENGVGLIITEGTAVAHRAAMNDPNVPLFHGDDALAGWARVLDAVHEAGGRIMPQLWHVGAVPRERTIRSGGSARSGALGGRPTPAATRVGPSGLAAPGNKVSEPMTDDDIATVISAYAQSAAHAKRLGFDGIEIHAAHGYLIDQFFWAATNERTDRYGGDLVARTRFGVEVVQACRRAVGADFPILLRFSQWKGQDFSARLAQTPELLADFLGPLADAGVDVFDCSTRRFWEPEFEGSDLNLAGWTKKLTGKPTITVGSVGLDDDFVKVFTDGTGAGTTSLDTLIAMVERDEVDLVAVGRALLADPAWAAKIRDGRTHDLSPFVAEALSTLA